ncbi:hypothetical protein Tco_0031424 [Tanacetum coccineum]
MYDLPYHSNASVKIKHGAKILEKREIEVVGGNVLWFHLGQRTEKGHERLSISIRDNPLCSPTTFGTIGKPQYALLGLPPTAPLHAYLDPEHSLVVQWNKAASAKFDPVVDGAAPLLAFPGDMSLGIRIPGDMSPGFNLKGKA